MSQSPHSTEPSCRFLEALRAGLERTECSSGRLVVAVSGGADSVALLRGVVALREELRLEPIVCHVDHGLRTDSRDDVEWLRGVAAELSVDLVVRTEDVARTAADRGRGIEETARDVRYAALRTVCEDRGAEAVAVAHTADDQVETVLHHLLRGTGLSGLRGIPAEQELGDGVRVVRPLLDIDRSTILAYLSAIGQSYREDSTNRDPSFTRNRIRHDLLPVLEADYNPAVRTAIKRLVEQAAGAEEVVDFVARTVLRAALLDRDEAGVTLDVEPLRSAPVHAVRAAFVLLWSDLGWPRRRMGFADWQRLADVARRGGAVSLPEGLSARVSKGRSPRMRVGRENADPSG